MDLGKNGAFIVGPARCGTTVLQGALNSSPDLFLFGEANWAHRSDGADFADWYNAMHRDTNNNQPTKSTYCPRLLDRPATWRDYYNALAECYLFVGDKLALGPQHFGATASDQLEFFCRNFYLARYILTLRSPATTIASCLRVFTPTPAINWIVAYINAFLLIIDVLRNIRHTRMLFYEDVSPESFLALGQFLGVELKLAAAYYDSRRSFTSTPHAPDYRFNDEEATLIDVLSAIYSDYRELFDKTTLSLRSDARHLEQKRNPSAPPRCSGDLLQGIGLSWHRLHGLLLRCGRLTACGTNSAMGC
jgi:hypothetical protein